MKVLIPSISASPRRRIGRWCLIAVATFILLGCRGVDSGSRPAQPLSVSPAHHAATGSLADTASEPTVAATDNQVSLVSATMPVPDASSAPGMQQPMQYSVATPGPMTMPGPCGPAAPPCAACGPVQPPCGTPGGCGPEDPCANQLPCGNWTPPGIVCPWPEDEYLCDGGDELPAARVRKDWSVDGLELEDTIVHYDTVQGKTYVEPTNRVCLYSPRFAAVRKVYSIVEHNAPEYVAGVERPLPPLGMQDAQIATTTLQPQQPVLELGMTAPSAFRERTPPTGLEGRLGVTGTHGSLLPYEDFTIIRRGIMDNSEKARLADRVAAAIAWTHDTAVQVTVDNVALKEQVGALQTESLYVFELGKSRMQVCKIASRKEALPGEMVEFTIRFDNVGDQTIGNVTVIDNLTTRLEYVDGSQTCTVPANFSASDNDGASLKLRWEIEKPLKVGEGGVIRFQCRVR